jgi:hypothetical protein
VRGLQRRAADAGRWPAKPVAGTRSVGAPLPRPRSGELLPDS